MGYTNLPPTVFDTIKELQNRLSKLENSQKLGKAFAFAQGSVSITPVAGTPTSTTVVLNPSPFTIQPYVQVTPLTSVPGTTVTGWSANGGSTTLNSDGTYQTSIVVVVTRTNTTTTTLRWLAVQMNPDSVT